MPTGLRGVGAAAVVAGSLLPPLPLPPLQQHRRDRRRVRQIRGVALAGPPQQRRDQSKRLRGRGEGPRGGRGEPRRRGLDGGRRARGQRQGQRPPRRPEHRPAAQEGERRAGRCPRVPTGSGRAGGGRPPRVLPCCAGVGQERERRRRDRGGLVGQRLLEAREQKGLEPAGAGGRGEPASRVPEERGADLRVPVVQEGNRRGQHQVVGLGPAEQRREAPEPREQGEARRRGGGGADGEVVEGALDEAHELEGLGLVFGSRIGVGVGGSGGFAFFSLVVAVAAAVAFSFVVVVASSFLFFFLFSSSTSFSPQQPRCGARQRRQGTRQRDADALVAVRGRGLPQ